MRAWAARMSARVRVAFMEEFFRDGDMQRDGLGQCGFVNVEARMMMSGRQRRADEQVGGLAAACLHPRPSLAWRLRCRRAGKFHDARGA